MYIIMFTVVLAICVDKYKSSVNARCYTAEKPHKTHSQACHVIYLFVVPVGSADQPDFRL